MERLTYIKRLVYFLLLCLALFVVFGYNDKPKEEQIEMGAFKPIEVVTDVKTDSVFGHGYAVRIKRLELVETEYWLHTDKKYKVGDTYTTFF